MVQRFPEPIDHVYILCSPDKEPERYAYLSRWLAEHAIDPTQVTLGVASYGTDSRFSERDIWVDPRERKTPNKDQHDAKFPAGDFWYDPWTTQHGRYRQNYNTGNLKAGELSLIWNWAAAAHQAVQAGHQVVAIFESDVLFHDNFLERLGTALAALPTQVPRWDFLSLSASAGLTPQRPMGPDGEPTDVGRFWFLPRRPDHPTRCTDSMIFRVPMLAKILDTLFPCAEALDWELNFQLTIHGAAAWWLDPPVCRQGSGTTYETTL